jgi:hypothetical protein
MKADGYGYVTLDSRHVYSTSPAYASKEVVCAVRAHTISIIDSTGCVIASHTRQFGKSRTESIDATSSIRHLAMRPGAWRNSLLRAQMPESVITKMDGLSKDELKESLTLLAQSFERNGVEATFDALDVLASEYEGNADFFQVGVLAARIGSFGLSTAPEPGGCLVVYDELFLGEEVAL